MSVLNQHSDHRSRWPSHRWWRLGFPLLLLGLFIFAVSAVLRFPLSLTVLSTAMIGAAIALPFYRLPAVIGVAIASPIVGFVVLAVLFWFVLVPYEVNKNANRVAVLNRSLINAPYLGDLARLFPQRSVTLRNSYDIILENLVHDRYSLRFVLPVSYSDDDQSVVFGEPELFLDEMMEIRVRKDGTVGSVIYGGDHYRFGSNKLNLILQASGDFSAAGFRLRKTPTVNIDAVKTRIRAESRASRLILPKEWTPAAAPR